MSEVISCSMPLFWRLLYFRWKLFKHWYTGLEKEKYNKIWKLNQSRWGRRNPSVIKLLPYPPFNWGVKRDLILYYIFDSVKVFISWGILISAILNTTSSLGNRVLLFFVPRRGNYLDQEKLQATQSHVFRFVSLYTKSSTGLQLKEHTHRYYLTELPLQTPAYVNPNKTINIYANNL